MKTKICTKCKIKKELTKFGKNKYRKNGYNLTCKICQKEFNKNYYNKNKEKLLSTFKKYYEENKKKLRIKQKKYYEENKEKFKILFNKHYEKNKEILKIKHAEYYQKHKEQWKQYGKQYYEKNYKLNNKFKLGMNIRGRIYMALKGRIKPFSSEKLLGCSIEFLKDYLKNKFKNGMTWDNHGQWHIDHIKPCSSFDLSKPEEQRKCFHYTNLQPLWAKENREKGKYNQ